MCATSLCTRGALDTCSRGRATAALGALLKLPFYLHCDAPADALYQLEDGRFQLIANGPIAPLMTGFEYVLAENALADFLFVRGLDNVRFHPATIYRRSTGDEYRTHQRLIIGQHFDSDGLRDLALEGERLLLMDNRYVFVSPDLKRTLEGSQFEYLNFSEGISDFAASA
jgi:hypothetical protein